MIDINIKGLLYGIAAAGHRVVPALSVCSGTKFAVRAISVEMKAQILDSMDIAIPPDAIARAIAFATEQPADVDVNEIRIRPTAQS